MYKVHRCQLCGKGCKKSSYNKFLVGKIPNIVFRRMIEKGLTCEDVYLEEAEND